VSRKRKTVCVDVDGVLAQYDGWNGVEPGDPIPGAVAFLSLLHNEYHVIIWTTRMNPYINWKNVMDCEYHPALLDECIERLKTILKAWLNKHGFEYDDIWHSHGKPVCIAFIDDRAISCRPQATTTPESEYGAVLHRVKTLAGT